jgi:hypothetical protein
VRYARIPYAAADDARRIVEFLVENLPSKLPEWEVKAYCGQVFDGDAGPTCHLYVDASSSRLVDAIASFVKAKHLHARNEAAKASNCPEVPEGRTNVVGEVVSVKNTDYGVKMLVVTDAGYKIYGSLPSALYGIERGARVSFTATLKRSHNDAYFGFYSRPTKAMVI